MSSPPSVKSPPFTSTGGSLVRGGSDDRSPETSFPKSSVRVLLLERISAAAVALLRGEGFQVETADKLSEEQLCERIGSVHAIGVRSKTQLNANVLQHAKKLLAIGHFCIGTDNTDLSAATLNGTAVFNSPYANTRSVAELVLGELVCLARQVTDRSRECHAGQWNKSAAGCVELRGKTLAIVGYGHVGQQLSILAEALGMRVLFYDVVPKLPLGNAKALPTLDDALREAHFLSLHVPGEPSTVNLIGAREIGLMRPGSFLVNASRGTVVDVEAAAAALRSGHLGGAAFDVFPVEPAAAGDSFASALQGCPNTVLTPHVGGSTEEAQEAIGVEVANKLITYINTGVSVGSVNLPELQQAKSADSHRILNIHRNQPGVMREVNAALADVNINAQLLLTRGPVGYIIVDVDRSVSAEIKAKINGIAANIRTRLLF